MGRRSRRLWKWQIARRKRSRKGSKIGGNQLNLAGRWQIDVVVRRKGLEDRVARIEWNVPPDDPPRPVIISNQPWEPILTLAAVLLLMSILIVIAVVSYRLLQ